MARIIFWVNLKLTLKWRIFPFFSSSCFFISETLLVLLASMSTQSVAVQAVKKSLLAESSRVVGTREWYVCLGEELVMAGSSPAG